MKLLNYIQETRGELKHVSWPSKKVAVIFTIIVVVISIGTAIFLGLFDAFLPKLLSSLAQ